jgi:AhpD family alkylhydroperoxidase
LIDLVFLRVSQINGCAYCVDLHAHDLLKQGEDFQRINSLTTWHETSFYSARERAALAWAEAVTRLNDGVPDHLFVALREHFTDREIADLGFAVAAMNAWNRMAISFRQPLKRLKASEDAALA